MLTVLYTTCSQWLHHGGTTSHVKPSQTFLPDYPHSCKTKHRTDSLGARMVSPYQTLNDCHDKTGKHPRLSVQLLRTEPHSSSQYPAYHIPGGKEIRSCACHMTLRKKMSLYQNTHTISANVIHSNLKALTSCLAKECGALIGSTWLPFLSSGPHKLLDVVTDGHAEILAEIIVERHHQNESCRAYTPQGRRTISAHLAVYCEQAVLVFFSHR